MGVFFRGRWLEYGNNRFRFTTFHSDGRRRRPTRTALVQRQPKAKIMMEAGMEVSQILLVSAPAKLAINLKSFCHFTVSESFYIFVQIMQILYLTHPCFDFIQQTLIILNCLNFDVFLGSLPGRSILPQTLQFTTERPEVTAATATTAAAMAITAAATSLQRC